MLGRWLAPPTRAVPIILLAGLEAALTPVITAAEATIDAPIHWGYAAYFGTGRYSAAGAEEIYALGIKPARRIREAQDGASGSRGAGIRLRVPITVSVHELDTGDVFGNVDLENVSTLSAVPGIELEFRMSERWRLKSLVHVGIGGALDGGDRAWIYWTGIVSELGFERGELEWRLVNGLTGVGFSPRGGQSSESVFPLVTAFEFSRSLEQRRLGGETVRLHWHVAHTHYLDELEFGPDVLGRQSLDIGREWEVGLAFGKSDSALKFRRLSFDRMGLAYRFGANGDFSGVSLVLTSLFER